MSDIQSGFIVAVCVSTLVSPLVPVTGWQLTENWTQGRLSVGCSVTSGQLQMFSCGYDLEELVKCDSPDNLKTVFVLILLHWKATCNFKGSNSEEVVLIFTHTWLELLHKPLRDELFNVLCGWGAHKTHKYSLFQNNIQYPVSRNQRGCSRVSIVCVPIISLNKEPNHASKVTDVWSLVVSRPAFFTNLRLRRSLRRFSPTEGWTPGPGERISPPPMSPSRTFSATAESKEK